MWSRSSYRISSISNAARMVSISTVALMVCGARPSRPSGCTEHVVPEPRLEVALHLRQIEVRARAVALRARRALWKKIQRRNRRTSPAPARRPPGRASRRGASRAGGRSASRSVVQPVLLALGTREIDGPVDRVAQVDLALHDVVPGRRSESSKSAMNTLAPELSALIIILRSTGPVISTRRSCRSAGIGPRASRARGSARVSGRKSGSLPASSSSWRATRRARSSSTRGGELAREFDDELERLTGEDGFESGTHRASDRASRRQIEVRLCAQGGLPAQAAANGGQRHHAAAQ